MNREFNIGDMFTTADKKSIFQYIKVSDEIDNVSYRYVLQNLDGENYYDSWMKKKYADEDLLDALTRGDIEHYNNWSIVLKEETVIERENVFNCDEIGFKGGE